MFWNLIPLIPLILPSLPPRYPRHHPLPPSRLSYYCTRTCTEELRDCTIIVTIRLIILLYMHHITVLISYETYAIYPWKQYYCCRNIITYYWYISIWKITKYNKHVEPCRINLLQTIVQVSLTQKYYLKTYNTTAV